MRAPRPSKDGQTDSTVSIPFSRTGVVDTHVRRRWRWRRAGVGQGVAPQAPDGLLLPLVRPFVLSYPCHRRSISPPPFPIVCRSIAWLMHRITSFFHSIGNPPNQVRRPGARPRPLPALGPLHPAALDAAHQRAVQGRHQQAPVARPGGHPRALFSRAWAVQ